MGTTVSGERPPPQTTTRRRLSQGQTVALYLLGTGVVIAFVFWRSGGGTPPEPERPQQQSIRQLVRPEILDPPRPAPPPTMPIALPSPPLLAPPPRVALPTAPPALRVRMRSYAAPEPPQPVAAAAPAQPAETRVSHLPTAIQGGRAGRAMDQTYLLMPGIYQCVLETAVSSEHNGPFLCHTSYDIYSPTGVLLMERGTRVVGQYQANVRQGQTRIPALSVTAYTPNGVPVPLGAQMADALGRVGLDGERDTHFWDRFGGATLLLLSQGAISAATSALQQGNGNQTINLGGGGYALQGVIAETLRGSVNIPPTITKHQGEEVAFFVTAPVSFADAYRVQVVR